MSGVNRVSTRADQVARRAQETPPKVQVPATATPRLEAERAVTELEERRPQGQQEPRTSGLTQSDAPVAGGGILGFLGGASNALNVGRTPLGQAISACKGWPLLSAVEQQRLAQLLAHPSALAVTQKGALQRLLGTQDWADMTATQQKDQLLSLSRPFKTKVALEASKAWGVLGDDVKDQLIRRLNDPATPHGADVIGRMVETQGFAGRDAKAQAKLLMQQLQLTTAPARRKDPGARSAQRTLQAQPAAADLEPQLRQRLDTLLAGARNPYARAARSELLERTRDPVYAVMTMAEKTKYLGEIACGTTAAPKQIICLSVAERTAAEHRLDVVGQPDAYKFPGVTRDATEHRAQIGGRSVPIVTARGATVANQSSPAEIAAAMATLPPSVLSAVKKVVLNPVRNPQDAFWEKTFNMKGFRAAATATTDGVINVFPAASSTRSVHVQAGYLAHEAGHLIAYEAFGKQVGGPGWARYTAAAARDGLTPSTYAKGNINEDFAETMELYLSHRGRPELEELRRLFPARFAVVEDVLRARGGVG